MYNGTQGGPPPGLTQQPQSQQQQQQQSQSQGSQWSGYANTLRGSPRPPNAPRSAAIPIIRPETSSASPSSTPVPRTATLAAPSAPASGTSPGASATSSGNKPSNASAFSKTAAGAAVFVPKGSSTPVPKEPPTQGFRGMHVGGGGASDGATSGGLNPLARPVNIGGPPSFPRSGPYAGAGYDGGEGGRDGSGYDSSYDPNYLSQMGGQHTAQGRDQGQPRPFNPYEHLDSTGQPAYDDGTIGQHQQRPTRQPLQYHLSAPPLPHTSNLHPQHLAQHAYFMSPSLREDLFRRNEAINVSAVSPIELGGTQTRPPQPEEVHVYKDLVPLEPDSSGPLPYGARGNPTTIGGVPIALLPRHMLPLGPGGHLNSSMGSLSSLPISASGGPLAPSSVLGGYPTEVHRATCTLDGKTYVLRRIVGFNLGREKERALESVERWRRLRCPGVVNVREAFTSWRWGEASIVFVYDFHPLSTTLFAEHLLPKPPRVDPRTGRLQAAESHVPERKLWSYLCQLTSSLRQIHKHGLAARCIEPGKVLLTGKNRVRLNCCSVLDVIKYDPQDPPNTDTLLKHQAEDLYKLGALILTLSCNSTGAVGNLGTSMDNLSRHYSKALKDIVSWLLRDPAEFSESESSKTIDELLRQLGPQLADEMEGAENYNDLLEESLCRELENARLVRLLCKMGFINERPEYDHDPNWSSTGERYLISLFRDYLFHSVEADGINPPKPVLDLSHILSNLNRLDAGSEDKLMLTSRDEQSCLVVSYKEIKNAIESAFGDLSRHM